MNNQYFIGVKAFGLGVTITVLLATISSLSNFEILDYEVSQIHKCP
jgi:hypothetical protein